jgi:hypothetical protein
MLNLGVVRDCSKLCQADMADAFAVMRRWFPWVLIAFTVFSLSMATLLSIAQPFLLEEAPGSLHSGTAILTYARMLTGLNACRSFILIGSMALLLSWAFGLYLAFVIIALLGRVIYLLLYPGHKRFAAVCRRYETIVDRGARRYILIDEVALVVVAIVVGIARMGQWTIGGAINLIVALSVAAVVTIFSITWINILWIRGQREDKRYLDRCFLSRQSIHLDFKNILVLLVFFAVLGWVFWPMLLHSVGRLEGAGNSLMLNRLEYGRNWDLLIREGYVPPKNAEWFAALPEPDKLATSWPGFREFLVGVDLRQVFVTLQHGMFLVVTIAALCVIGIPSIAAASVHRGRRNALRTAALATLKSGLVTIGLELFARKAYFVDISQATGIGTVFSLTLAFFLMMQTPRSGFDDR